MEVKKAYHPDKYLCHIIRPGSVEVFNPTRKGHLKYFTRMSDQKPCEESFICHDGRKIEAGKGQPIFHGEPSAMGTEDKPLNIWRIAHLTNGKEEWIIGIFKKMGESKYMREFNEVYIHGNLQPQLVRK
jgi:hypothetical protein